MTFYINENSVRGGVRGGKKDFDWDTVKQLNYKERDCYLGASTKINTYSKGDKWYCSDWWLKDIDNKKIKLSVKEIENLKEESLLVKEKEDEIYENFFKNKSVTLENLMENNDENNNDKKITNLNTNNEDNTKNNYKSKIANQIKSKNLKETHLNNKYYNKYKDKYITKSIKYSKDNSIIDKYINKLNSLNK